MKTIRLLYPDHVSGGLDAYYFGANLLANILPQNENQPLVKVGIFPPDGQEKTVTDGIYAKDEVIAGIDDAMCKVSSQEPDKIITIGGNCMVSLVPFDYLNGKYNNVGIVWIDAHPDVSVAEDGYPNAHAMVLGALMGVGEDCISNKMRNDKFNANQILYVGLQELHDYQEKFLNDSGIDYTVQNDKIISLKEIQSFTDKFDHILVHFDIDAMDENLFHSTYFANKELVGDGAGGGKMTLEQVAIILKNITANSNVVGITIAEYLPFDEYRLHKMFSEIDIFTE